MPRCRRIDAPGVVHHVTMRGIERRSIFADDQDREDFLSRLDVVLPAEGVECFAWTLMTNHVHLVLRSGPRAIGEVLRRIATGYAGRFNRRHDRAGHLLQGRFGSRPLGDTDDVRIVIRYVHANPLRAGLVTDLAALAGWPWCGHGALTDVQLRRPFHSVGLALAAFDECPRESAHDAVTRFMNAAIAADPVHAHLDDLFREAEMRWGVSEQMLRSAQRGREVCRARSWLVRRALEQALPRRELADALGVTEAWLSRVARQIPLASHGRPGAPRDAGSAVVRPLT